MTGCALYLLTPAELPPGFEDQLRAALDAAPVAALQLRLKPAADEPILRAADRLRPITQAAGVALILNDRPDLVAAAGADGAHVGGQDMDVAAARRLLGEGVQLGASCYDSRDRAMAAAEAGADYVAFGSFFPSATKTSAIRPETALLSWWSELMEPPCVAIGGITAANCAPLVRAGVDFLAVCAAVWGHAAGAAAGVRALEAAVAQAT